MVRELESLIGLLQHAATVVPAGRAFLRRLIALVASRRNHNLIDGPPQPSGEGGFGVVGDVFASVERTRLLRLVGRRVYGDVLDRRVGFVGMWRGMGTPVVSAPLVDRLAAAPNRGKRAPTGGASGSVVGREVVGRKGFAALG